MAMKFGMLFTTGVGNTTALWPLTLVHGAPDGLLHQGIPWLPPGVASRALPTAAFLHQSQMVRRKAGGLNEE